VASKRALALDQETLRVLSGGTLEDGVFRITAGQLPRKLYESVNEILEKLGGRWDRKARGHVFQDDPSDALDRVIISGEIGPANEFDFFETPKDLARRMVEMAEVFPGQRILEPSAGKGAILREILSYVETEVRLPVLAEWCEIDPARQEACRLVSGRDPVAADFLSVPMDSWDFCWNRILMNPPFSRGRDVEHITHAHKLLAPGGRLVAIASGSVGFRQERRYQAFRDLVAKHGYIEPLPAGTFKASGTDVNTVLVVMDVPA
jgi:SAM-dependent methyltransferase